MKRDDAETMARRINMTLVALEGRPEAMVGVRATALMIAGVVASDGRITEDIFLKLCGLRNPDEVFLRHVYREEGIEGDLGI